MPQRPKPDEYKAFQASYVGLVPEEDIVAVLQSQVDGLQRLTAGTTSDQETFRYAPEKWSVREVFGHLADAERIFGYRALCVARGQTDPLPPFDENRFVETAHFDQRKLADLSNELLQLRRANLSMLSSLDDEAWMRTCSVSGSTTSTRAIAWVMAGHMRHHLAIFKERYGLCS